MPKFQEPRQSIVCDTECYPNYWSISFLELDGERHRTFERTPTKPLDADAVRRILRQWRIFTFNGIGYDMPMIGLALIGASNQVLKQASDDIILSGMRPWEFEERYGARVGDWCDHVDLMEVSPGSPQKPSLKLYAGRLHSKRMQDLPIDPMKPLTPADVRVLRAYGINDLLVTRDKVRELMPQIELRAQMSDQYGVDLRSKSDAQVAEAVIRAEIERKTGQRIYKPDMMRGTFYYKAPSFIQFERPELKTLLSEILRAPFVVDGSGKVEPPPPLSGRVVQIGRSAFKLGNGGIHSMESRQSLISDEQFLLIDRDVTSYYPNIILGQRLYPKHLGTPFLDVYRTIYERRIEAKRAGRKNEAETLKIVLNGSFGKFGSPYSVLYSPHLLIQTTVTGQLAILLAVEWLEDAGFAVVSANTDGIVTRVSRERRREFEDVFARWEQATGFATEETEYSALYSRDVNSYIAIGEKVKTKGTFTQAGPGQPGASGMKKNPDADVVTKAVVDWLKDGKPIEQTIRGCTDIRQFVSVRRVRGGALDQAGAYLGKAIRWYYGIGETGPLVAKESGNTVPRTDGAKPCMQLPDEFPLDVDHDWYVREAYATLQDIGVDAVDPRFRRRQGTIFARLPDQSTWHIVDLPEAKARCGRLPKSIRAGWLEVESVPVGQRLCKQCDLAL